MQKLTVDELKRLLYDTFCDHLTMKDIENIIMTEESHMESSECQVDIDSKEPVLFTPIQTTCRTWTHSAFLQIFPLTIPITIPLSLVSPSPRLSTASPMQQVKHTCVRKSLICAFAIAFIISVMLIAANQMLRRGMK